MLERKRVRMLICAMAVFSTLSLMSCSENSGVTESNVIAEGTEAYVTEVTEVTEVESEVTTVAEVTAETAVETTAETTAETSAEPVAETTAEPVAERTEEETSIVAEGMSCVNGPQENHLSVFSGRFDGPSGEETFYNLDMSGCVSIMRDLGYDSDSYTYWERSDGCKMFGPYIMVAANLDIRPKGSVVETSLGTGMVCDTGGFAAYNPYQLDIAVTWVV